MHDLLVFMSLRIFSHHFVSPTAVDRVFGLYVTRCRGVCDHVTVSDWGLTTKRQGAAVSETRCGGQERGMLLIEKHYKGSFSG